MLTRVWKPVTMAGERVCATCRNALPAATPAVLVLTRTEAGGPFDSHLLCTACAWVAGYGETA
jgi:hypothetical protein